MRDDLRLLAIIVLIAMIAGLTMGAVVGGILLDGEEVRLFTSFA